MSHPNAAYQSTQAPGGAFQVVTATSRFKTFSVQGISADLVHNFILLYNFKHL
mgnify:CR=1 FL=1